jgi:nitroimidazol reductase NimA-like FMN-containing flavoprotein (pyridoxamine 5'-phosphate oxidase superfamily)
VTDRPTTTTEPAIDRPAIPPEYGVSKASDFVRWAHVEERLAKDRVYWIVTAGADGRPRARPVDGMYVDGVIYVGGSEETRWIRDLVANPHVSVHLDGVVDVVIIEGEAEVLQGTSDELAQRLAAASNAKFPEYGMTADSFRGPGPVAIRPRKVVAWTDFTKDPTRFRFDDPR